MPNPIKCPYKDTVNVNSSEYCAVGGKRGPYCDYAPCAGAGDLPKAETPDAELPDMTWKKDDLIAYAKEKAIEIDPTAKKEDILEAINAK